ncbi:hypothetical protein TUM4249_08420 [Shewanella sp. KT0246]|nr:hypothetical protein TUM4249_08420 [Shewanella sp. KT0246]
MDFSSPKKRINLLFNTAYFYIVSNLLFYIYSSYALPPEYTQTFEYIMKSDLFRHALPLMALLPIHIAINAILDDLAKIKQKLAIMD